MPVALTIAGSDSSGGAGIAADLKTFEALGVWGACAITAVTAQNTLGVQAWEPVSPGLVRAQIASVLSDPGVAAAKTGMLGTAAAVDAVADLVRVPLVVDPVLAATTGALLSSSDVVEALRVRLLPRATVLIPNLSEAAAIADVDEPRTRPDVEDVARRLGDLGPRIVLVTGGHLAEEGSPDCLLEAGGKPVWLEGARVDTTRTHGTGCVLSAAICAGLAKGMEPADACEAGKRFLERALAEGRLGYG